MKNSILHSRLEHFLKAYEPIEDNVMQLIYERLNRAGWSRDDPASLQIAHDTIIQVGMASYAEIMHGMPQRIENAICLAMKIARQDSQWQRDQNAYAIAEHIAGAVEGALLKEIPKWEYKFLWRVIQHVVLVISLISLTAFAGGYILGRTNTAGLAERHAQFATEPDASTWLNLHAFNTNLDEILSLNCRPGQKGYIATASGKDACVISLWTEDVQAQPTKNILGKMENYIVYLHFKFHLWLIIFIGAIIGISISFTVRSRSSVR